MTTQSEIDVSSDEREAGRVGWRIPLGILLTWIAVAVRAIPATMTPEVGDRGIFVSVAERLLAGDRLYTGVWENHDPLYFYVIAVGRAISPAMDIVIELAWIALAAFSAMVIARRSGLRRPLALSVAWVGTPLIITGVHYFPGNSHPPGIAMTLAALAAAMSARWVVSGIALGLLWFVKIPLLPLGFALVLTVILLRRSSRAAALAATGLAGTAAVFALLLALRGELGPYIGMLRANVGYANSTLTDSALGPVVTRLARVAFPEAILITLVTVAVVVWVWALARREPASVDAQTRSLTILTAVALGTSIVILAASGLWWHHDQILYVPAVLTLILIIAVARRAFITSSLLLLVFVVAVALVLAGSNPRVFLASAQGARAAVSSIMEPSVETRALRSFGETGSYARIGTNDDYGSATGLRDWALACPAFHQYPYDPEFRLQSIVDCLPDADAVIVSPSGQSWLASPPEGDGTFADFLSSVRAILDEDFTCEPFESVLLCRHRVN